MDDREMVTIQWCAEKNDLSRSQALRRIVREWEEARDTEDQKLLNERRLAIGKRARKMEALAPSAPRCPNCGEEAMYTQLTNGHWRCDLCLSSG
jgi:hypothetical protein